MILIKIYVEGRWAGHIIILVNGNDILDIGHQMTELPEKR